MDNTKQPKAMDVIELHVDPTRYPSSHACGIYVRAKEGDKWGAHDIATLTRASLDAWLRSRGGENPWAEAVVAKLLGWDS